MERKNNMTYYPGIDMNEKIKNIFDEYYNKHKSENILNYDLKELLSQYRQEIIENECPTHLQYDEDDMDERYDEGKSDGKDDLIYETLHYCFTHITENDISNLKKSLDKLDKDIDDGEAQKEFTNFLENLLEWHK